MEKWDEEAGYGRRQKRLEGSGENMTEKLPFPKTDQPTGLFEDFWAKYPIKAAKGHARGAFRKALKKTTSQEIMNGLERFLVHSRRTERAYIPHAATWLNGERWEDEIEIKETRLRNDL